ncbi:MAG: ABC transporter substrate-binding protein [Proteobacteria bacterium SG_bin9]|nr:MAG: ABC transporter substrate-binding protein [Proteobacteria bacterium SG_bin9]
MIRRSTFDLSRRSLMFGSAALVASPLVARTGALAQQPWPARSPRFVVPFAAGGTTDILARLVAQKMSEEMGQQFIVENKTGAGGNIAADYVSKIEPDGYTFLVGTPGTHGINPLVFKSMTYDPAKDLAPVTIIARVPNLMSVTPSLPPKSVAEFLAFVKSKPPGEILYGTPGLGSTAHLSTELFKSMTGLDMTHVPYKGSAPAVSDLIAGRIHVMIDNLPAVASFAEAGSVRPLAISTAARWPLLPNIPTIAESGVPNYEASSYFTIAAPVKTPPDIIAKLNASVNAFIKSTDGTERIRKLGGDPVGGSPADMTAYIARENEKWTKVAAFAKIAPE